MKKARNRPPFKVRFAQGWNFTKGSWSIFRSDKELASFPVLSFLATIVLVVPFVLILIHNPSGIHRVGGQRFYTGWPLLAWVCFLLAVTTVGNFFSAAVMYGAMERFRGGDPTFRSSLRATWRKRWPILLFGLFMGTVGILFQLIIERLPFAAKLVAVVASVGWAIANFFSLPVILFSDEPVMPVPAMKRSIELVKQTWGESVVASGSIGIITGLIMLGFMGVWFGLIALGASLSLGLAYGIGVGVLGVLGFVAVIVMAGVLGGIIKAALYYYATTGQAPTFFSAEALQAALVQKRASRLFNKSS